MPLHFDLILRVQKTRDQRLTSPGILRAAVFYESTQDDPGSFGGLRQSEPRREVRKESL